MYNVLVVDDEIMVCKGISLILEKSALKLGEIFIAKNGFEALDIIRLERVDLVVTDIQMEQMNGIELMETIYLEDPSIPVIVLSAHGEFEYAQKAMKFGAREYIVKPVRPDHLIGVVGKALQERETKIRSIGEAELSRKFKLQDTSPGQQLILQELAFEGMAEAEALELLAGTGLHGLESRFSVMLAKPDLKNGGLSNAAITSLRDRNLLKYACRNLVEETLQDWKPIAFFLPSGLLATILQLTEKDAAYVDEGSRAATIAQKAHNHLVSYLNVGNAIGISGVGIGIGSWPRLLRDAQRALDWHGVHADHYVFYAGDFGQEVGTAGGTEPSTGRSGEPGPGIGSGAGVDTSMETLQRGGQQARPDSGSIAGQTMAYIDLHYRTKGLKLQDIAGAVHLSPNYLSYVFKKEVGMNMWDYVTQCRMTEGKRLLLSTDKRRYEIADEIGYETPEHFSKIFKRYYGIPLSEFKK